jgi:WD40 repeat protein
MIWLRGCLSLVGCLTLALGQPARGNPAAPEDQKLEASKEVRTDDQGDPLPAAAIARLGTIRLRHIVRDGSGDACLTFSPDGKKLVSGGDVGLCMWDVATGKELGWFRERAPASKVQFLPDGKTLITLDNRGSIRTWRAGKSTVRQLDQAQTIVHGMSSIMSADGKVVGVLDMGYHFRLWDAETGRQLFERKGNPRSNSFSTALSPDGKVLAVVGEGNWARLLDVASGKEIRPIEEPDEPSPRKSALPRGQIEALGGLTFSPDGRYLAATFRDTFSLWEVSTGKLRYTVREGGGGIYFTADGKYLACAGEGPIRLYEVANGKEVRRFERHAAGFIHAFVFSPDGKTMAAAEGYAINLWDVATGKRLHSFSGHETPVISLAFSPDGADLASGDGEYGTLLVRDLKSHKLLRDFRGHFPGVLSVAYSPDGKLIASGDGYGGGGTGGLDAQIRLWSAADGKLLRQFPGHLNSVQHLAFSPDGKTLASAGHDARAKLWDVATGKRLHQLRGADAQFRSVAFSPNGSFVAVASTSGELALWEVDSGQVVREFGRVGDETRAVGQVAFLADGKTILSREFRSNGERGQDVRFWDIESGKELHSFGMNTSNPHYSSCALSPDGKSLAIVSGDFRDSTIQLRDAATGKIVGQLQGHAGGAVTALTFSPDSKLLASGGRDTTVLLWDVSRARMEHLLAELASGKDDAARAIKKLGTTPGEIVPYLKERLRRVANCEARASDLIVDLDADEFEVREKASKELENLGPDGAVALRQALQGSPSPEARSRMQKILDKMKTAGGQSAGFEPRSVWLSLAALEEIGSPDALQALQELAKGPTKSTIVREAGAAVERLAKRQKAK